MLAVISVSTRVNPHLNLTRFIRLWRKPLTVIIYPPSRQGVRRGSALLVWVQASAVARTRLIGPDVVPISVLGNTISFRDPRKILICSAVFSPAFYAGFILLPK